MLNMLSSLTSRPASRARRSFSLPTAESGDYYLSPTGSNSNDGLTPATPWKTFAYAFATGGGQKKYVLMDGTYSVAAGTGVLTATGTGSAQIPSGASLAAQTQVVARNSGGAVVDGAGSPAVILGLIATKHSYITIKGVRAEGEVRFYNTSYCTLKNTGVHGYLAIGTNDHANGNTYNLVEDCWSWTTEQRSCVTIYRADFNIFRRFVQRADGCGLAACQGSGNPNNAITIYDSADCQLQNVICVDRYLAAGDQPYGDFTTAQKSGEAFKIGRNKWLGCMSINSADYCTNFEADNVLASTLTMTIENFVGVQNVAGKWNINIGSSVGSPISAVVNGATLINAGTSGDCLRFAPEANATGSSMKHVIARGAGGFGLNSKVTPSYVCVFANGTNYNQTTPTVGVNTTDPFNDGTPDSLLYPVRIETGSVLKGAGEGGTDIGATVLKRYGAEGSRHGETDYETLTATDLWPWPNEARIKSEMSVASTRGFCAAGTRLDGVNSITLTSYVWESLGNAIPAGIY